MKIGVIMVYKLTFNWRAPSCDFMCVFVLLFSGEDIYVLDIIDIINDLFKLGVKNNPKKMNISLTCSIFIHIIYIRIISPWTSDFFVAETHASAGR